MTQRTKTCSNSHSIKEIIQDQVQMIIRSKSLRTNPIFHWFQLHRCLSMIFWQIIWGETLELPTPGQPIAAVNQVAAKITMIWKHVWKSNTKFWINEKISGKKWNEFLMGLKQNVNLLLIIFDVGEIEN